MLAQQALVRFQVGVGEDVGEFGKAGGQGAWEAVERVEEEAVGEEGGVEAEEVEKGEGGGGAEGGEEGLAEVLDPRDKGDDVEEDVGLEDGEDVEVFLAVVELRVEGGWLVGGPGLVERVEMRTYVEEVGGDA